MAYYKIRLDYYFRKILIILPKIYISTKQACRYNNTLLINCVNVTSMKIWLYLVDLLYQRSKHVDIIVSCRLSWFYISRPRWNLQHESHFKRFRRICKFAAEVESRTQGSRPRTKNTASSVLQEKKRSSKSFFRQSPIYRRSQNFWLGRPNHMQWRHQNFACWH